MTTYTTRPSTTWKGYVDILKDDWVCASVPAGKEEEHIAYSKESTRSHFQAIADRHAANDPRLVIASGCAYSIGSPHDDPKGFGGTRWLIRFFDSRVAITDSLWCMGDIPAEWRVVLQDNATLTESR